MTVDEKIAAAPWPTVMERASQIEDSREKLRYLLENQPATPFDGRLTANGKVVLPDRIEWWIKKEDSRIYDSQWQNEHLPTVQQAIERGESVQSVVIGFYVARPWSWLDRHVYWDEEDRIKGKTKWITGERQRAVLQPSSLCQESV